jgi:hypothetical protein
MEEQYASFVENKNNLEQENMKIKRKAKKLAMINHFLHVQ